MTAHVRAKHTEKYEEFKENRLKIIEENTVHSGEKPAAPDTTTTPITPKPEEADTPTDPEEADTTTDKPAPKEQTSGGFLGFIEQCLNSL
ncbi:MAG: hypothetical protein ACXQTE_05180 [Methanosarcinaceae archaeon]